MQVEIPHADIFLYDGIFTPAQRRRARYETTVVILLAMLAFNLLITLGLNYTEWNGGPTISHMMAEQPWLNISVNIFSQVFYWLCVYIMRTNSVFHVFEHQDKKAIKEAFSLYNGRLYALSYSIAALVGLMMFSLILLTVVKVTEFPTFHNICAFLIGASSNIQGWLRLWRMNIVFFLHEVRCEAHHSMLTPNTIIVRLKTEDSLKKAFGFSRTAWKVIRVFIGLILFLHFACGVTFALFVYLVPNATDLYPIALAEYIFFDTSIFILWFTVFEKSLPISLAEEKKIPLKGEEKYCSCYC